MKGWLDKLDKRKQRVIKDDRGQWDHPGEITEINSNNITMKGVPYPVLGISNSGDQQLMQPGGEYKFKGSKVTEYPIMQDGGKIKDNIPNLDPDIPLDSRTLNPQAFMESYLQSPIYKDRLKKQGYSDPDKIVDFRLSRLKDVSIYNQSSDDSFLQESYRKLRGYDDGNLYGSHYNSATNKLVLNNDKDQKTAKTNKFNNGRVRPDITEAHELSHASVSGADMNYNDSHQLYDRLKDFQVNEDFRQIDKDDIEKNNFEQIHHDAKPTENKADIDAMRYMMYKNGTYDTRKDGKFTKDHLKKLYKTNNYIKNRLQNNYNDEDLIWLMNNIADNSKDKNIKKAQNGMTLSTPFGETLAGAIDLVPEEIRKAGPKKDVRKSSDVVKLKSTLNSDEVNYVRTSKSSDKTVPRTKPVEQQASDDFVEWYSDPATKEKFTKNTGLDSARLQDFIGRGLRTPLREAESNEDIGYLSQLGADAVYQSPYVKEANNSNVNKKSGEILYQKQRESTSYSKAPNMRSVLGHEIAHASKVDAVLGPALQRVLGDVNNQTKGTFKRDREYLAHPEESYGNFHMFRKNLGLKPGQKVNEKQLKKLVEEKDLGEEIFYKAYDDDKIVKAINTIASSGKPNNQQTNRGYAKNGKKLINFDDKSLAILGNF